MQKVSAGILLYRRKADVEVFLVHPGGPFWIRKDLGSWSIPKGEPGPDEDLLSAAMRELGEETGCGGAGEPVSLGTIRQAGGKTVHAWAIEGDCDPEHVRSNTFTIEWPLHSGRQQEFPEVDLAGWFGIDEARAKINRGQVALLDRLLDIIGRSGEA